MGSGSGRKTVNVEVRSPWTYVKRDLSQQKDSKKAVEKTVAEPAVKRAPKIEERWNATSAKAAIVEQPVVAPKAEVNQKKAAVEDVVPARKETLNKVDEKVVTPAQEEQAVTKKAAPVKSRFVDDIEEKR